MGLVVAILLLALLLGGVGLFVEGLFWVAVIGLVLFIASGFMGFTQRGRTRV
jgi:hypothetical protein